MLTLLQLLRGVILLHFVDRWLGHSRATPRNAYLKRFGGLKRALMVALLALIAVGLEQGVHWASVTGSAGDEAGQQIAETIYIQIAAIIGAFVVGLLLATNWIDLLLPYAVGAAILASIGVPDASWRVFFGAVAAVISIAAAYRTRRFMQDLENDLIRHGLRK